MSPPQHQTPPFVASTNRRRRAERFNVPVDFLLQQVAYLTERHASQVRAQVLKATAAARGSAAPSPGPGHENPRTSSALSVRRDSPLPRRDGSVSGTPVTASGRPSMSRNTSANANASVLRDVSASSPRLPATRVPEHGRGPRQLSSLPVATPPAGRSSESAAARMSEQPRRPSPGPAESSSTASSDEDESSPAQSRIIRRPPRFQQQQQQQQTAGPFHDGDDEGSEPAFQPLQAPSKQASAQDLASTLKGHGASAARRRRNPLARDAARHSQTSDSSAGSALLQRPGEASGEPKGAGPLSPRRAAELAGRSPGKAKANSGEGSDGTPSMGSSFSDLDGKPAARPRLTGPLLTEAGGQTRR